MRSPRSSNYHALAAQVIDRYGILAGIETGRRVLSQAQRVAIAGRVLDEMSFEHVKTEWQPSVVDKILNLDGQIANHLVDPDDVVAFVEERLPVFKEIARTDRVYHAALERIELARAVGVFRRLKRDLGVIDFGDQIELAVQVATEHPEVGQEYRDRFAAVLLDEYQDTNVAQARLMRAMFAGGHPVTAVGDPDQNIYAWRGASLSNLFDFPTDFPKARRLAGRAAAAVHELPVGGAHPARRRHDHLAAARRAASRPRQAARAVRAQRRGRGHGHLAPRRAHRGARDRRSHRCPARRRSCDGRRSALELVRDRGALPHVAAVLPAAADVRRARDPGGDRRARRSAAHARGRRGAWRTRARPTTPWRAWRSPASCMGPRYRVGFKELALVAGWAKGKNYAWRDEGGDDEETPFLFAEALEHLDEVEGLSDEGRARLEEFRAELSALRVEARRPVPEFLGEVIRRIGIVDELEADVDRAAAAQRSRNLAAFLDQVHAFEPVEGELTLRAFLDYVDSVEELEKEEWEPVQPSDVRLGEGHDDPPGQGTRVRPRLRAGRRGRADAVEAHPAEPGRARLLARLRAARRRGDPALVRRRALALQARPAGPGGDRGTPHDVRGAHARPAVAARERVELVRRERARQGTERVLRRARRVGNDERGGRR